MSSSTSPPPGPSSPDPSSPEPGAGDPRLSSHETAILAAVARHEREADPRFAALLSSHGADDAGRGLPGPVVGLAVAVMIVVLAGFVLPGAWVVALIGVVVLLVVPVALVRWAWQQEGRPGPG